MEPANTKNAIGSEIADYVVNNIDNAIREGWIKVYYQPVIRTLTGQLCGAESLSRWQDPVHGLLPPYVFIGALEDSNQIHKLDCYIVDKVCSDISERLSKGLDTVPVSVNFSKLDFENVDMLKTVEDAVEKYDIPRDYLHVEITESMIVSDEELMKGIIDDFRRAGFEVWMDDFGSGYSSLNLLKDYQFDTVKMDMDFLSSFTDKSKVIMTAAISMTKDIGIKTLAEGVETEEQVKFLFSIGCGKLQGYFYGKPMPIDDFFAHIKEMGITVETRKWRNYYQTASFFARYTEEPLEVVEDDGREFRTLFMNPAYKSQIFSRDYSLEEIDRHIYHTNSPLIKKYREFADIITKTKNFETFYYTFDGNILCFQAKEIAENEGKHLIKGSIRNISIDNDFKKQNNVGNKLRELNHLFETVMVINIDNDTIYPLIGYSRYLDRPGTEDKILQSHILSMADRIMADADRDKFLEFVDTKTLKKRIDASGKGFIENIFRMKQPDGNYQWRELSIMTIPGTSGKEFLVCTKATADDAQPFLASNNQTHDLKDYGVTQEGDTLYQNMWESIVADSSVRFFWKDKDRRYLGASMAFLRYFDIKLEDIYGKNDEEMGWCIDQKAFEEDEKEVLTKGILITKIPGQCIINGVVHNILSDKRPIYKNGQIAGLMGHCIDVDEQIGHLDKFYKQRRLDPITGLMTFSALTDTVASYAHNYVAKNINYALIIVRDENYHRIVKDYGEEFGNKILKKAGEIILEVTQGKCAVAKCLGSDFGMVTDTTEPAALEAIIGELAERLGNIKKLDGKDVTTRIKIGYKLRNEEGITDENMYSEVLEELRK